MRLVAVIFMPTANHNKAYSWTSKAKTWVDGKYKIYNSQSNWCDKCKKHKKFISMAINFWILCVRVCGEVDCVYWIVPNRRVDTHKIDKVKKKTLFMTVIKYLKY